MSASEDPIKIDSRDIEWALMQRCGTRSAMCPRFTPSGWWECDVAELTDADFFVEYEIKMSRSDFARDAHKSGYVSTGPAWSDTKRTTKHELCAQSHKRAPNRFYFVTPQNLLPVEAIPKWAGLIEITRYRKIDWPHCNVIKRAPLIHNEKKPKLNQQIAGVLCGRIKHMWSQQYYRYCERRRARPVTPPDSR